MQQSNNSFNLRDAGDVTCDECESLHFVQVFKIKRISPVISPTGQEVMAPIQIFSCKECGHINKDFLEWVNKKLSWKPISNTIIQIILDNGDNSNLIGRVTQNYKFKWKIDAYFAILAEDKSFLEKEYDTDIKAGRILAKLWNNMEEIDVKDTEEFFVNFSFDDLFGPID